MIACLFILMVESVCLFVALLVNSFVCLPACLSGRLVARVFYVICVCLIMCVCLLVS